MNPLPLDLRLVVLYFRLEGTILHGHNVTANKCRYGVVSVGVLVITPQGVEVCVPGATEVRVDDEIIIGPRDMRT